MNCRKCGKYLEDNSKNVDAQIRLFDDDKNWGKTHILCKDCTKLLREWLGSISFIENTGK